MLKLSRFELAAKIFLSILLACTVFGAIASLLMTDIDFLAYIPQNLFGLYYVFVIFGAFTFQTALFVFIAIYLLTLSALFLSQLFYRRIKQTYIKVFLTAFFCFLLICDAIALLQISTLFIVPIITDCVAVAISVFLLAADVIRRRAKQKMNKSIMRKKL